MKLKRILYLSDMVGLGGGEISLINHLSNIDRNKFLPVVLCPITGMLTDELLKIGIETKKVYWKRIRKLYGPILYYPFFSFIRLLSFLKNESVDVVNANSFNAMTLIAPAAKLLDIPMIWTCHGWWPTGKASGIFINHFVDKVIAVSGFVKNKLLMEGFVTSQKIIKIHLGIDHSKYSNVGSGKAVRREFHISKNVPVVGMIGRFQKIKGHNVFVRMATEIIKKHYNVQFMMIGSEVFGDSSESDYGREIHNLIMKNGLGEKIVLTGFRYDIPRILKALNVLVVPSEVETFGMVVLEAMATGIPVVSCAQGGPREIIQNGKNGFIINEQNHKELAKKVVFLLENPHIRETMGLNGKRHVADHYQIRDQVNKIESLYLSLLNKPHYENINHQ